jgi:hypothetical protein
MSEMIESLDDNTILRLIGEARQSVSELEGARALLQREMARRGILFIDTTGFIDALQDTEGMIEPSHVDSRWQTDFDSDTHYVRGSD